VAQGVGLLRYRVGMSRHKKKPTVCLSWISPGDVRHEFTDSITGMMLRYSEQSRKVIRATVSIQSGPRVAEARSQIVDNFAKTNCDWLLMVDADMVWEDDALDKLLEVADEHDSPIVGGLCFGGRGGQKLFPTVYKLVEVDGMPGTEKVEDYPKDAVVTCGATGAAFLLVHKRVFVEMRKAFGVLPNGRENPYPWFVEAASAGRPFGEDIAFCMKAQAMGIPVKVHTGVKIGHVKPMVLTEELYLKQRAEEATTPKTELSLP
jgi:hypothetical protein